MASPAELDPRSVNLPERQLHTAEILDSATDWPEPVRCVIPDLDPLLYTMRMSWNPIHAPAGHFYPKKGDEALVATPGDGPPRIVTWTPSAAEPDVPAP